ncbi:MAG: hypothetical protein MSS60_02635 [Clostridiales bacterium]|nr:hypothetical protein [Clostridiales bacterium]
MFEIRVTIACPDLLAAAKLLARNSIPEAVEAPTAPAVETTAAPMPVPAPTPVSVPAVPATSTPVNTANPAPTAASVVPLSQGPTYTLAQIAKAGADLISQNPGLMPQVNALLAQYGVQAVTDVKPEHYGAFATALRGLGAKI